jgi:hypothetical protein
MIFFEELFFTGPDLTQSFWAEPALSGPEN